MPRRQRGPAALGRRLLSPRKVKFLRRRAIVRLSDGWRLEDGAFRVV